jgi:UDP-2,3-diacylglucosamine pyrophosphatase LpxH
LKDYVRLIISDLHLGSINSKESKLAELLSDVEFDELILAGDIIDFIKIPTFTEETVKIFQTLKDSGKKIIYIIGNHDETLEPFVGKEMFGVEFRERYEFEYAAKKYRIVHTTRLGRENLWVEFGNMVCQLEAPKA